jgi:hypothetical protein
LAGSQVSTAVVPNALAIGTAKKILRSAEIPDLDEFLVRASIPQIDECDAGEVVYADAIHQRFGPTRFSVRNLAAVPPSPVIHDATGSSFDGRHALALDACPVNDPGQPA